VFVFDTKVNLLAIGEGVAAPSWLSRTLTRCLVIRPIYLAIGEGVATRSWFFRSQTRSLDTMVFVFDTIVNLLVIVEGVAARSWLSRTPARCLVIRSIYFAIGEGVASCSWFFRSLTRSPDPIVFVFNTIVNLLAIVEGVAAHSWLSRTLAKGVWY